MEFYGRAAAEQSRRYSSILCSMASTKEHLLDTAVAICQGRSPYKYCPLTVIKKDVRRPNIGGSLAPGNAAETGHIARGKLQHVFLRRRM